MTNPDNDRSFQRWLNKAAEVTGFRMSTEERQRNLEQQKYARCEKWKAELLNYSTYRPFLTPAPRIYHNHHEQAQKSYSCSTTSVCRAAPSRPPASSVPRATPPVPADSIPQVQ